MAEEQNWAQKQALQQQQDAARMQQSATSQKQDVARQNWDVNTVQYGRPKNATGIPQKRVK